MSKALATDLGHNILLYSGSAPEVLQSLRGRTRFLDVLWLPSSLDRLSPEQIGVINRFREGRITSDPQFRHASTSRSALTTLLAEARAKSVLEIGCGKFPVDADLALEVYRGIEIDPVAIAYCQRTHKDVGALQDFSAEDPTQFDYVVSLYAFHFSIGDDLVQYLEDHLHPDGCIIFNMIVDNAIDVLTKIASLSQRFALIRIVKTGLLAEREFFFVLAKKGKNAAAEQAADRLTVILSS